MKPHLFPPLSSVASHTAEDIRVSVNPRTAFIAATALEMYSCRWSALWKVLRELTGSCLVLKRRPDDDDASASTAGPDSTVAALAAAGEPNAIRGAAVERHRPVKSGRLD